jgi:two-component system sensor histidine kinase SenX3
VRAFPLSPRADTARPAGAFVLVEDISEGRRIDQVRRDFVANISHELRSPIGALRVLAEAVVESDDPEATDRLANRMIREVDRIGSTIGDLLELANIEFDEDANHVPVSLGAVVEEAVGRVAASAEQHGVAIQVSLVPAVVVRGDRRQLVSAVTNLLDNAVKYDSGGKPVDLAVTVGDAEARIAVTDHGVGIPARDLDRVFERFYRVDRARSRDTGGTGLGLAIVRHVAQNHGGSVDVESKEGEGSTFTLVLPVAERSGSGSG